MAILKRRQPRRTAHKVRESLWPSMGWRRTGRYYRHRLFRTGDSTYRIAAGLASGVAVSFSPFLGTHFVQAVTLSWLVRGSLVAGFVGTAAGNPWTFPFIFWLIYQTGIWFCGLWGLQGFVTLPDALDQLRFLEHPMAFIKYMMANPLKLLLPLTIGGYLWVLLSWPLAYGLLYYPVRLARRAYERYHRHRRSRRS